MKDQVIQELGVNADRVLKKAEARGITHIIEEALERAQRELPNGSDADRVKRAAIRARQRVGVLPRPHLATPPAPAAPAEAVQTPGTEDAPAVPEAAAPKKKSKA